jgi:hypothetical protein
VLALATNVREHPVAAAKFQFERRSGAPGSPVLRLDNVGLVAITTFGPCRCPCPYIFGGAGGCDMVRWSAVADGSDTTYPITRESVCRTCAGLFPRHATCVLPVFLRLCDVRWLVRSGTEDHCLTFHLEKDFCLP